MIRKLAAGLLFYTVLCGAVQASTCLTTPCFNPTRVYQHAATQNISKQQAAQLAQNKVPGRVLSISREEDSYRVKILRKSGEVVIVFVNATTGDVN